MNKPESRPPPKRFPNIALMIFSVIMFFSLCEITLRLVKFSVNQAGGYFQFRCFRFAADKYYIPKNTWDPYLFWRSHTKENFNTRRHSLTKEKNVYRIICLGDSTTQGFIKPNSTVYAIEETYPYMLERILNRNGGSIHFEVINAGCGGYTSFQGLRFLKSELLNYNPELLIVLFGTNDADRAILYSDKEQRFPNELIAGVEQVLSHSKFYQFYKQGFLYFLSTVKSEGGKKRVSARDYHANLREIVRLAKKNNLDILFIMPYIRINSEILSYKDFSEGPISAYAEIFAEFSRDGIPVVNMANAFRQAGDYNKYFIDTCHVDADGNRIIAETVYSYLVDKKIVPVDRGKNYVTGRM